MPIVISEALALSPGDVPLNTPIFGWDNLAESGTVTATTEDADHPATNLANVSTALRWIASPGSPVADEYLTVTFATPEDCDYLAVGVHNLGTGQFTVSVEGDAGNSPQWEELVQESIQANDDPIIFRFTPTTLNAIRLRIQPSPLDTVPFAAVLHTGKLLVMPRGTHTDHVPINLGIKTNVMSGRSETGNFIGRVILSEGRETSIAFQHLASTWYRTYMKPFVATAKNDPFFFAWKPQEFPTDVGYCWLTNDPQPSVDFNTKRMGITLQMGGVAV